jgi:tetratricopeptide (TPR) repeat protein
VSRPSLRAARAAWWWVALAAADAHARKPDAASGPRAPELELSDEVDEVALWRDMAGWYMDNRLPEEAMAMVARLRERGEDSPELDLIQGRALLAQGMPDEARHVLEAVAARLPRDPRPLQALAVVQADLGHPEEAISWLERAAAVAPDDADTLNNLGFLEVSLARCDAGVAHLERALALDGTVPRVRNNLAFALVCVGEATRALALFRSTGREADARYNMGVAYERLDKIPSALAQYQAALDADPTHPAAREAHERLTASEEVSP